jgi:hypothetical protein
MGCLPMIVLWAISEDQLSYFLLSAAMPTETICESWRLLSYLACRDPHEDDYPARLPNLLPCGETATSGREWPTSSWVLRSHRSQRTLAVDLFHSLKALRPA